LKVWIVESEIAGMEIMPLDEDKWKHEEGKFQRIFAEISGEMTKYIVGKTRRVILVDGNVRDICSPQEEVRAL
jgi:hypothetical protein